MNVKVLRDALVSLLMVAVGSVCGAAGATPEQAARGVLQRLLENRADAFVLESIPKDHGLDVFEIESVDGKIVVRGSDGVAIASGANWYLRNSCHCQESFCGDQIKLPARLPVLKNKVRHTSPYKYRYCFNFCAFSYTLAWWDWDQWQRMIDWMALHGINMPLSVTGQEAVWQAVYRKFGLTDQQIGQFLVGPGYLPFGWMGCIDGWGGPLPQTWIDQHLQLQKKIVQRERELGMTPVLQGFTGHVPAALKQRFPDAKLQRLPSWCQFPGSWFVDPRDPLFQKVGKAFVDEQTRQFGTSHLYASDTFIEMSPPSDDPAFLAAMSKAVYGAMAAADPEAIWVMQGWLFFNNPRFWKPPQTKALFDAVPNDRMIALDLYCEVAPVWQKTEAFHGKPWVWCIIHNYGGKVGMYGGLPQITANLKTARTSPKRGELKGIGLIMEGFGYNPIVYDLLTDMTWRGEVPALKSWTDDFVVRRYGQRVPAAQQAWRLLGQTVYRLAGQSGSTVCARPSLHLRRTVPYDSVKLAEAWDQLLACADQLGDLDTYQYDVVHLTRQVLGDLAGHLHADVVDAYAARDPRALGQASRRFLDLMRDMDMLLGTRREFLLGKWLGDAKRWATTDQQRRLYEWNARNLITLWGPRDSGLHEYARRQWSGLMRGFYLKRWEKFVDRLNESVAKNKPFDASAFEQDIRRWEEQWTHATEVYPDQPQGDSVLTSQRMWRKYRDACRKVDAPDHASLSTGKPTRCSSYLANYLPSFANDGRTRDTNAFWATDTAIDKEPWWQVDLEKPMEVGRVVIVSYYGDERYYGFVIETSLDGEKWDVVADRRDNRKQSTRAGYACRFPPRRARLIRVKMTHNSANTGRHLVEVMVYAK